MCQLRLDPFTIFLDENHCENRHILNMLAAELEDHERVERALAHFDHGTLDEVWLPKVGRNGWIVISADKRIWRRSVQRQALFNAGVRAFIFTENNLRGETRAKILKLALPEMRQIVKENPPPFIASLTVEGHAHIQFTLASHKEVVRNEKRSEKKHVQKVRRKQIKRRVAKSSA